MTLFVVALTILAAFLLAGLATMPRRGWGAASTGDDGDATGALLIAPTVGGLSLIVVAWLDLLVHGRLSAPGLAIAAALVVAGAARLVLAGERLAAPTLCAAGLAALLALVAGLPFRSHLAPPDVDSQLYAYFTWLIGSDRGFPVTRMFGPDGPSHVYLATAGNDALAAVVMRLTGLGAGLAQMYLAIAWVVAILLCAFVVVRRLAPGLPTWLCLLALVLAFNSAFVWQYGGGSYGRVPASAALVAIAALLARGGEGLPSRATAIAIGFLHGAMLYMHARFFVWGTVILGLWILLELWRGRHTPGAARALLFVPLASAVTILPVVLATFANLDLIAGRTLSAEDGGILSRYYETWFPARLWANFARFQGLVMHPLIAIGLVLAIARGRLRPVETYALCAWVGVLAFHFDPLVTAVAPVLRGVLYADTAALSDFVVPKVVFGTVALLALHARLARVESVGTRRTLVRLVAVAVAALVVDAALKGNLYTRAIWNFLTRLPGPMWQEFAYATLLAVAALVFARRAVAFAGARFATALCAAALALLGAYELDNARFANTELYPEAHAAFRWLAESTDPDRTLVLTAANLDVSSAALAENWPADAGVPRVFDWSLPWLPIVAERPAVFHRANLVARFSDVLQVREGEALPLAALDRAFFRLDDPGSLALLRETGVTHVYVSGRMSAVVVPVAERATGLRRVYRETVADVPGWTVSIYEVVPDAADAR
ncbi:hypothetical protein ACTZWW_10545 [Salinarimonas sp. NSM]|uniref:hypothetical protein n=1 Tax=Salinarimonas sp. NSM TaxID=3458003 RepID=UPI0040365C65